MGVVRSNQRPTELPPDRLGHLPFGTHGRLDQLVSDQPLLAGGGYHQAEVSEPVDEQWEPVGRSIAAFDR